MHVHIRCAIRVKNMNREEAYKLLQEMIKSPNLIKHGLAVEAIMRALCMYLRERHSGEHERLQNQKKEGSPTLRLVPDLGDEFNEEEWAVVGLLHDADYELVAKELDKHTLITAEKLRELGVSERIIEGIKAHHFGIKDIRENIMEHAVYAADDTSGFITAVALVRPDKKLSSVTVESLMKKFKDKDFAKGARREQILACEKDLSVPLEEFLGISLEAMQNISDELGL